MTNNCLSDRKQSGGQALTIVRIVTTSTFTSTADTGPTRHVEYLSINVEK